MATRKIPVMNAEAENYKAQIEALIADKENQKKLINNLLEEVKELRAKRTVTEEEWTRLQNISTTQAEYQARENKMALWVRNNKKAEIGQGRHTGLDIADVMIMYAAASCPTPEKN